DKLKKVGKIQLRFTRILLPSGEYEYFASNLTLEEFATQDIGDLYRMRWGIETAFDDLKNKLHIENFTGTKPILLEQDIYATFYLCNIVNGIIFEAQSELDKEKKSTQYKHKMAINKNIAIGIMKEELIHILTDTE